MLHRLSLEVDSGDALDVRRFVVEEGLHRLFEVDLEVASHDPNVDLEAIIGRGARFSLQRAAEQPVRFWEGVVSSIEQIGVEQDHLSTYRVVIRPRLWLLTQRRDYRIFQHISDPAAALAILERWGISVRLAHDPAEYRGRKYRVQYAESDYAFVRRLLEDAGVTFYFEQHESTSRLVLADRPQANPVRTGSVHYENRPLAGAFRELATNVRVKRRLRPGRYTQRDVDYRRPAEFPLMASATSSGNIEDQLERFHHNYGSFLFSTETDGASPAADDHGAARTDLVQGQRQVQRRLAAKRNNARRVQLSTSAHDLAPGSVFRIGAHPRNDVNEHALLVVNSRLEGEAAGKETRDWQHLIEASYADASFHPPLDTPKPRTHGVESATVVGPEDDEIHTDEFGRVRVKFHWDRGGTRDERASCWVPVSQPWGGAGFGAVNIPRVGQEVLIDFLGADPDRPVVIGRVFTKTNPVPYALPQYKTVTGIRSQTSVRYVMGASDGPAVGIEPPVVPPGAPSPLAMPSGSGQPMGLSRIQGALDTPEFGALSPNSETHRWSGSELTLDDTAGNELMYMQAQRDMSTVVKNTSTTVVGNCRSTKIGSDDLVDVDNEQVCRVAANRSVAVGGSQTHHVQHDIEQASLEGNQTFATKESFVSEARHHVLMSRDTLTLQVGASCVAMFPDFIIVQTPHLFLNPGEDALFAAVQSGERPESAGEQAAREQAEADSGALAALEDMYMRGDLENPSQFPDARMELEELGYDFDTQTRALEAFDGRYGVPNQGLLEPYPTWSP